MIRVVHVINSLDSGGAERFAVELIRRLDRSRFEPHVLCLYRAGTLHGSLSRAGISTQVLGLSPKLQLSGWWRVLDALRRMNGQVLHTHLPEACWYGLPAGWLAGIPVRIGHVQNTHRLWSTKVRMLDRMTSSFATRVIACSQAVHDFCEAEVGYRRGKTQVIHNAIDTRRFHDLPSRDEARRFLNLPQEHPILVCVASLTNQKGHTHLLRALVKIRVAFPGTILLLVGEGPLRSPLSRLASELSISGGLHFLGIRSDIPSILASSDLFVLPSLWEGFGLVLAEAGAAGLPTVATRVDGIVEVIDDGATGVLVPPENPDELALAVIALLEDPEGSREMGLRARERVDQLFSIDTAVGKVEDLYAETFRAASER